MVFVLYEPIRLVLFETIDNFFFLEIWKKNIGGGGGGGGLEYYLRFMCIAPFNDYALMTLNLPLKVILWRFEVDF